MANNFNSNDIYFYPSGYRQYDNNGTTEIVNIESRFGTEYNTTSLIAKLTTCNNGSYVVNYDSTNHILDFYLKGYHVILTNVNDYVSGGNLYVKLLITNRNGSTYKHMEEVGTGTNALNIDSATKFLGITYVNSLENLPDSNDYFPLLVNNVVPDKSYFRLTTKEIGDGTSANPISKVLNTQDITTNTLTANTTTTNTLNQLVLEKVDTSGFKVVGNDKTLQITANLTNSGALLNSSTFSNTNTFSNSGSFTNTGTLSNSGTISLTSSANSILNFRGNSDFYAGTYNSNNTSGGESITVANKTFNVLTRDTSQTISSNKTLSSINYLYLGSGTYYIDGSGDVNLDDVVANTFKVNENNIKTKVDDTTYTHTFPNSNNTVCTTSDTQTLTNKTIGDTLYLANGTTYFINNFGSANLKNVIVEQLNTSNTLKLGSYTYTFPGANSTLCTLDTNQTISGIKTLTSNLKFGGSGHYFITPDGFATLNGVEGATATFTGRVTANNFYATSDARLKENIKPFEYRQSILDLPIYNYDFKQGDKNQIGCLAQDLQKLYPELVNESASGYLSIQESKLVYLLMEEVKSLKTEIEELKKNK